MEGTSGGHQRDPIEVSLTRSIDAVTAQLSHPDASVRRVALEALQALASQLGEHRQQRDQPAAEVVRIDRQRRG